jgi:glutaconate CoA-transferase subunit A
VTGVVHAPYGAHPTSFPPAYGWDMDHFKKYAASAAEDDGWSKYVAEFIAGGETAYVGKVGGAARIAGLKLPIF